MLLYKKKTLIFSPDEQKEVLDCLIKIWKKQKRLLFFISIYDDYDSHFKADRVAFLNDFFPNLVNSSVKRSIKRVICEYDLLKQSYQEKRKLIFGKTKGIESDLLFTETFNKLGSPLREIYTTTAIITRIRLILRTKGYKPKNTKKYRVSEAEMLNRLMDKLNITYEFIHDVLDWYEQVYVKNLLSPAMSVHSFLTVKAFKRLLKIKNNKVVDTKQKQTFDEDDDGFIGDFEI